jgi:hypothetical protein
MDFGLHCSVPKEMELVVKSVGLTSFYGRGGINGRTRGH